MSFRKYGGLQYAAKHNIVSSNYNTANNLLVTQNVGQPNSYITFLSDISGNTIYGNLDVSGNLSVSGNETVGGNLDVSGNEFVGGNLDVSGNEFVGGNLDVSGNENVGGNLDVSGNVIADYMFLTSGTNYTTSPNGVVPKSYIDSVSSGLTPMPFCILCENVAAISLTGYGQNIDGYTIDASYNGSAILINAQGGVSTPNINNGVYIVNSGLWTRASYLASGDKATGTVTNIIRGNTYSNYRFVCTTGTSSTPAFIDVSAVVWSAYDIPISIGQGLIKVNQLYNTIIEVDPSLNFLTQVGIGNPTFNPAYVLDVSGNSNFTNDILVNSITVGKGGGQLVNNTAFGTSALTSNTTGAANTANGYLSLYSNTTGNNNAALGHASMAYNKTGYQNTAVGVNALYSGVDASGACNVAVGFNSMYRNTSGSNNVAIGSESLQFNTTGVNNTALGFVSMFNNTTGVSNTALGVVSMYYNKTGYNNTAVGEAALQNNTTGYQNTAVGMYALYSGVDASGAGIGTGSNNTANGYQSLFYNTTGSNNTANGYAALFYNTTGNQNVANGYQALYSNTTGVNNTANGYQALYSNTTGPNNTANGYQALYYNTTGFSNVALGVQALYTNTIGANNTALGFASLYSNTTGINNTALGFQSLYSNTTGINNTALGLQALYYNTTGVNNTANGYQALLTNTTGNQNVANGYQALYSNTTGPNNTAIGLQALYYNTTGNGNVAVGVEAGFNIGATTCASCTFLGGYTTTNGISYSASTAIGYGATITTNNQIVLGTNTEFVYIPGTLSVTGATTLSNSLTFNSSNYLNRQLNNVSYLNLVDINGAGTGLQFYQIGAGTLYDNNVSNGYHQWTTNNPSGTQQVLQFVLTYNQNVSYLPTIISTNLGPGPSSTFAIQDTISSNIIYFMPNASAGNFNPIVQTGSEVIFASNTNPTANLVLTTWSSTCTGLSISPNSLVLGAGGTSSTPSSNITINGSTNQISIISNTVQIGTPGNPTTGKLTIYENTGTGPYVQVSPGSTPIPSWSAGIGSLVISHNNAGCSSIVFPSWTNYGGGDYGYIQYFDNVSTNPTAESGLLLIGIENDVGADRIVLYSCQGNGYVGINNLNPTCSLDVSGNTTISGTLTLGITTPSSIYYQNGNVTQAISQLGTYPSSAVFLDKLLPNPSTQGAIYQRSIGASGGGNGSYARIINGVGTIYETSGATNFYVDLYITKNLYLGGQLIVSSNTTGQPNNVIFYSNISTQYLCYNPTGLLGFWNNSLSWTWYIESSGAATFGTVTATSFNATSDYRIKENIKPLDSTFTVDLLNPVTYFNKQLEKQDVGLIAHELQEVFPFLVTGEKDGESNQSVNYNGLIGVLIKEIQDLKERVKILENK